MQIASAAKVITLFKVRDVSAEQSDVSFNRLLVLDAAQILKCMARTGHRTQFRLDTFTLIYAPEHLVLNGPVVISKLYIFIMLRVDIITVIS